MPRWTLSKLTALELVFDFEAGGERFQVTTVRDRRLGGEKIMRDRDALSRDMSIDRLRHSDEHDGGRAANLRWRRCPARHIFRPRQRFEGDPVSVLRAEKPTMIGRGRLEPRGSTMINATYTPH
jgi:hypothetical protein